MLLVSGAGAYQRLHNTFRTGSGGALSCPIFSQQSIFCSSWTTRDCCSTNTDFSYNLTVPTEPDETGSFSLTSNSQRGMDAVDRESPFHRQYTPGTRLTRSFSCFARSIPCFLNQDRGRARHLARNQRNGRQVNTAQNDPIKHMRTVGTPSPGFDEKQFSMSMAISSVSCYVILQRRVSEWPPRRAPGHSDQRRQPHP